jgi:hypothetical protein
VIYRPEAVLQAEREGDGLRSDVVLLFLQIGLLVHLEGLVLLLPYKEAVHYQLKRLGMVGEEVGEEVMLVLVQNQGLHFQPEEIEIWEGTICFLLRTVLPHLVQEAVYWAALYLLNRAAALKALIFRLEGVVGEVGEVAEMVML